LLLYRYCCYPSPSDDGNIQFFIDIMKNIAK
jgi:hypothetical protein